MISSAKEDNENEMAADLVKKDSPFRFSEGKERLDICSVDCLKNMFGELMVDENEKGSKNIWKQYVVKLMNEENECDQLAERKEAPADCITASEVAKDLSHM